MNIKWDAEKYTADFSFVSVRHQGQALFLELSL